MSPSGSRRNIVLLLLILLLDLIGFSLIFPLVPDLLEFYLKGAPAHSLDSWLIPLTDFFRQLLPAERQSQPELIILLGGILASVYSFLQFLLSPVWGRISDSLGRRPVLLITSTGLAFSYILWAISQSFTLFILSRVVGGIMSGNIGVASAAMADQSSRSGRTSAMGLVGAAFGVGFIIGPVVGGSLASVRLDLWAPDAAHFHPFTACAIGSFILSISSALLNLFFLEETLPKGAVAEKRKANPFKSILQGLQVQGLRRVLIVNFFYILLFSGFEFSVTFFYKLDFGFTPFQIGMVFLYLGLIIAIGQGGLVRYLSKKITEKRMALIGLILLPPALVALSNSAPLVWLSLLCLFPVSLGSALLQPALSGLASLLSPVDRQGFSLGVFRSAGALARAIGPLAGAYLYWVLGIKVAYGIFAALLLLTLIYATTLADPRAKEESHV
ncbi:MAG: MFS transporter [Leptospiraceae bacterium]|nr:MFS transporter [Leptospiraceae bacterium]MCB1303379.1 MFS transporter [Leptospiraceae bacterium]